MKKIDKKHLVKLLRDIATDCWDEFTPDILELADNIESNSTKREHAPIEGPYEISDIMRVDDLEVNAAPDYSWTYSSRKIVDGKGVILAEVYCHENPTYKDVYNMTSKKQMLATANLISASWDMFHALAELMIRVETDAQAKNWWPEEQRLAASAIKKALGEA